MSVNLWEMLPEAQRARFAAAGRTRRCPAGTVLTNEGDPGGWAVVVTRGHVKVVSVTPTATTRCWPREAPATCSARWS